MTDSPLGGSDMKYNGKDEEDEEDEEAETNTPTKLPNSDSSK